jgi:hypothetical protein
MTSLKRTPPAALLPAACPQVCEKDLRWQSSLLIWLKPSIHRALEASEIEHITAGMPGKKRTSSHIKASENGRHML